MKFPSIPKSSRAMSNGSCELANRGKCGLSAFVRSIDGRILGRRSCGWQFTLDFGIQVSGPLAKDCCVRMLR
jgi:hypothetical protein